MKNNIKSAAKSAAKRITALISAAAMLLMSSCSGKVGKEEPSTDGTESVSEEYYSETTENVKKSETVYVNLDSSGKAGKITVSDWLHADKGGVNVKDTTTLKDFTVTKGQATGAESGGNILWQMSSSDVYYEGTSDKELPVEISIKYYLDGNEISPEELAGKSGKFKMEVSMKNNVSKEVEINGKKVTMYTPLAAVGGMVLPYEKFSDIDVSNGLAIGGGSYEVVVLAGAPGLNESLNLSSLDISGFEDFSFPDTFTVTADVTDFALADMYYAIVPLSSLSLSVELPKTLEDVKDILNEIGDMQEILDKIDPNRVLEKFMTDGASLKEMMSVMQDAVNVYESNEALLKAMSEYLTPENIEKLTNFVNSLDAEQMNSIINLLSNVPALQSAVDSLLNLSTGISGIMPILEGLSEALKNPEVAAALENLPETLDKLDELMGYLNENQEVLSVLSKLMSSEDMGDFTKILDSMITSGEGSGGSGSSGNDADVSQLTGDAKELVLRMDEWMKFGYGIYTSAPDYMQTSCMFICKTNPINAE